MKSGKNIVRAGIAIAIAICSIGIFTACTSSADSGKKSPMVSEIESRLGEIVNLSDMMKLDEEGLERFYEMDTKAIEEFSVYIGSSNLEADEVLVIKAKDSSGVQTIKTSILKRKSEQSSSFRDYLPEEYNLLEKAVLRVEGNYIFYGVSPEASKLEQEFLKSFY